MKLLELQPTYENLIATYKNDSIERNTALHYFVELLESLDGCTSISVNGKWGCGKTFFVKQAKMIIDSFNEHTNNLTKEEKTEILNTWRAFHITEKDRTLIPQVCVYYDAWQHDNDDDPLLSLVYEIYTNVENDYSFKKSKDCIEKCATIADLLSSKNYGAVINKLRESDDPLTKVKENRSLTESINDFISSILPEQGDRLIIFIDELDRCKPTYAVRLLERIKHYFSNKNVTFVFSVNLSELQHTVKQYYGAEFDASKYLNRFFDIPVTIPKANLKKFYDTLSIVDTRDLCNNIVNSVIKTYNFELREIAKYRQLIKLAAPLTNPNGSQKYDYSFSEGTGRWLYLNAIVPIALGLQLYNNTLYNNFLEGKDATPLIDILSTEDYKDWVCSRLLSDSEEFEDTGTGKTVVKIEDKLKEYYDALFNYDYNAYNRYQKNIGRVSVTAEAKKSIFEAISVLSRYADYSE
ncbi:MAG: hypothetical protein J6A69_00840 [Clostridia bacterium]|nr:hypothetical protein [Clostridia bacterium]